MKLPSVVIVGRSNVGKSSLFNTITEKKQALVLASAGTTRDRLESEISWRNKKFALVDTGGLDPQKDDIYRDPIISQALTAQKGAAVILFMVDVLVGILPDDQNIVKKLRKLGAPIILVANKCDNPSRRAHADIFKKLNLPLQKISAINGSGTGDLLDSVVDLLPAAKGEKEESEITLALIGKPNVGKSSILNSMYGEERMIVSEVPHTTRDSQDVNINCKGKEFCVIDTAGIRRKTKQGGEVEHLSINKSQAAIARADVVALIVDISESLTSQDKRLASEIEDKNKGLILVANKWDKIPDKDDKTINKYTDYIASNFPSLSWVPIIFTSAKDNKRTKEILALAKDISENLKREIEADKLMEFIKTASAKHKPTIGKGTRRPRLLSIKQDSFNPPSFTLDIPNKTNIANSYKQYLTNELREEFDFEGVPIKLTIKERQLKKTEMNVEKPKKKRMTHRSRRNMPKKIIRR